ncbi:hypothetical protein KFK09_007666 [Dendrobium nobile]|uniref:Uncharacterized protein n=1 Tax=Dendrobium nobile TaxID=94219 RepID=A0A8T3BSH4_DENNO|nr:hypothetical protein KFK09_007666 [Dendrobium nobile]
MLTPWMVVSCNLISLEGSSWNREIELFWLQQSFLPEPNYLIFQFFLGSLVFDMCNFWG